MPDCERENFLGANFQDLGAKTFESLATQDQKMQMKHFASCVGVNNIECKTQEEEHDVVSVSCVSHSFVDCPDEASEGGCWDPGGLSWAQPFTRPLCPEQRCRVTRTFGSRNTCSCKVSVRMVA